MAKKLSSLGDQIRAAIDASGLTRYRICKETGIEEASMSRFMLRKGGMTLAALERVAELLQLEVTMHGPKKSRKGK